MAGTSLNKSGHDVAKPSRYLTQRCVLHRVRDTLSAETFDGGAAGGKLVFEPLEAAVEMIDAVDHGLAFGSQRGNHQRDGGAQIGGHDRRSFECVDPLD